MATYRGHAFYIVDPRISVVFCKISSWHVVGSHVLRVCHGARDERQDQCRTKLCHRCKNNCLCKFHRSLLNFSCSLYRVLSYAFCGIGQGFTFQISVAYSAIVRSLENLPEPATFKMALRAHSSGLAYSAQSRSSASRYDFRSAKCM